MVTDVRSWSSATRDTMGETSRFSNSIRKSGVMPFRISRRSAEPQEIMTAFPSFSLITTSPSSSDGPPPTINAGLGRVASLGPFSLIVPPHVLDREPMDRVCARW